MTNWITSHSKTFNKKDLPSGKESVEIRKSFMGKNIEIALAIAYKGYTEFGKGFILVNLQLIKQNKKKSHGFKNIPKDTTPVTYFGENDTENYQKVLQAIFNNTSYISEDIKRMVTQYNPEKEIVWVFIRLDNGVSSYRNSMLNITAKECYARYKNQIEMGEFTWT